jgi:hypothetical protein
MKVKEGHYEMGTLKSKYSHTPIHTSLISAFSYSFILRNVLYNMCFIQSEKLKAAKTQAKSSISSILYTVKSLCNEFPGK